MRTLAILCFMMSVSACAMGDKGVDVGIGLDAMNTVSKEEKENDAWFDSFYGKNHCGVSQGTCAPGENDGGGSGGGSWGGGVGPSD